jgi:phosphoribosylglycinamide formyltransferase 1
MANLAVLASGKGTNFDVIRKELAETDHELVCLICDRKHALVLKHAEEYGVPAFHVSYQGRSRQDAELEMISYLKTFGADLIAFAGFMRVVTKVFIDAFGGNIINIHPTLLPRFPGADGIERSYRSEDKKLGITIHRVTYDLDSGPVLLQRSFTRSGGENLEEIEKRIHTLEYESYSKVIIHELDAIDAEKRQ